MSLPQPDFGVLRKAQRGDERAFSIIVRAYQVPVFNYVLRLVGDRSLAEDLTQEVFLRVFQGLPRFSLRSKFTTWLFQVTKNRVLDELRAMERRPRKLVDIEDIPPLEVLDAPFERLEAIDAVWRAIEALNVDLKKALLLRDDVAEEQRHLQVDVQPLDRPPDGVDRLEPLERSVEHLERRHVLDVDDRARPALHGAQLVEYAVLRHLEEPRRELRAEREARQALEDAEEDLLRQILGQRPIADETQHVVEDRHLVRAHDEREGAFITTLGLPQDAEVRLGQRQGSP
ncbi:MAG: hypothetical protein QOI27_1984 [Gaiellaceae bacterium]|nr:hypothetical protein [Gaiellaceae bacterium]